MKYLISVARVITGIIAIVTSPIWIFSVLLYAMVTMIYSSLEKTGEFIIDEFKKAL